MKHIKALGVTAVCLIALIIGSAMPAARVSGERFLSDARRSYRGASVVVIGECADKHNDAYGNQISRVMVNEVVAGKCSDGKLLSVRENLAPGKSYLLYLTEGEDVVYAEDEVSFESVSDELFLINGSRVEYGGSSLSLSVIKKDMAELDKTISAPAAVYFYDSLEELLNASENVFIGRIIHVPPMKNINFRSQSGGNTVEKKSLSAELTIKAYGSIKGTLKYGQMLCLMYTPSDCKAMLSASTLESCPMNSEYALKPSEGATYLFFTEKNADPKQNRYCPVNPIQGWIGVEGDKLIRSEANSALAGYSDLGLLVSKIRAIEDR